MASIEDLKSRLISRGGLASANQFGVVLPSKVGSTKLSGAKNNNILCKSATLPGRQITTLDRQIGLYSEKIANGFLVEDVTLTFHLLNDYSVRKYFDAWMGAMVGHMTPAAPKEPEPPAEGEDAKPPAPKPLSRGAIGWKDDYVADIVIHQLKKPQVRVGFDLGPLDINLDMLGGTVYSVKLIDAFPTNVSTIQLSDDLDGLVEVTVTFSYTNWEPFKADKVGLFSADINLNFGGLI